MGYSADAAHNRGPAPVGVRLTGVSLYCQSCHRSFYTIIYGSLARAKDSLIYIADSTDEGTLWEIPACAYCGGGDLYLWERLD